MEFFLIGLNIIACILAVYALVCAVLLRREYNAVQDELTRFYNLANIMADARRDKNSSKFWHAACHIIRMTGRWDSQGDKR